MYHNVSSSFFNDLVMSPGQQRLVDDDIDQRNAVLRTLSTELMARFGWTGFSPPNSDGWHIPLLEISPFDVSPSKRRHWMKLWSRWKESGRTEAFAFSLVYLYGRNKLAMFPTSRIIPYEEGKLYRLHLLPRFIQNKFLTGAKLSAKEHNLRKGIEELTSDLLLSPNSRVERRARVLEASKENQTPAPYPKATPQSDPGVVGGRSAQITFMNSRVKSTPPSTAVLMAPARRPATGGWELSIRSPPRHVSPPPPPSPPPGLERSISSFLYPTTDNVESAESLEHCVIHAAKQVWNLHNTNLFVSLDHDVIQSNFRPTLGVSLVEFTKLVNDWILHKFHLEKLHNQWFKDHVVASAQSSVNEFCEKVKTSPLSNYN